MLVDGLEHGNANDGASGSRKNPETVSHEEARLLYRSAILSRFTAIFLMDLVHRTAAETGVRVEDETNAADERRTDL
jgi:hypothetical protein